MFPLSNFAREIRHRAPLPRAKDAARSCAVHVPEAPLCRRTGDSIAASRTAGIGASRSLPDDLAKVP